MILVGVISDTHGLLRPEALVALQGCELVIHAGDVGRQGASDLEVLAGLEAIAPVLAVRGNVDGGQLGETLPYSRTVAAEEAKIFVIHDVNGLRFDPAERGLHAVVSGHSHRPSIETRQGVLYVNPGAAGPRRFDLPVTVARIQVSGTALQAEIIRLLE